MIPKPPLWEHFSRHDRYVWYEEQLAKVNATLLDSCIVSFNIAIDRAAEVAECYEPKCDTCPRGVSNAIRNLKERRG